ncbi:MAG: gluconokinase [Polaromonas sp.]|nr:gluconokinase [Polaromonas sp.]
MLQVVVMGVAGCGKSAVGRRLADELGLPLVEGDDFHPARNTEKMQRGVPLTDNDRAGWLQLLGAQLAQHAHGAVLTCSALKMSYRDSLRQAVADAGRRLYFIHLAIDREESLRRVAQRKGHFYPPSLVTSQFETLEDPSTEAGVLVLPGDQDLDELTLAACQWLRAQLLQ